MRRVLIAAGIVVALCGFAVMFWPAVGAGVVLVVVGIVLPKSKSPTGTDTIPTDEERWEDEGGSVGSPAPNSRENDD